MQRILILLIVSVIIFEARPAAAFALAGAAALALLASLRLPGRAAAGLHPLRMLRFIPWFLGQSAAGGVDVAVRAFRGPGALSPALVRYQVRLQRPVLRVIFANTLSLMPGTLNARLHGDIVTVHALDDRLDVRAHLADIERRVGRAFGEEL